MRRRRRRVLLIFSTVCTTFLCFFIIGMVRIIHVLCSYGCVSGRPRDRGRASGARGETGSRVGFAASRSLDDTRLLLLVY